MVPLDEILWVWDVSLTVIFHPFGEFSVNTVMVDFISRNSQRSVLIVPSLHTSIRVISPIVGLLPYSTNGVSVGGYRLIEVYIQLLLQDHAGMKTLNIFWAVFTFIFPIFSPKGWLRRSLFSKIQHSKPSSVPSTSTILFWYETAQGRGGHRLSLPRSKVRKKPFI